MPRDGSHQTSSTGSGMLTVVSMAVGSNILPDWTDLSESNIRRRANRLGMRNERSKLDLGRIRRFRCNCASRIMHHIAHLPTFSRRNQVFMLGRMRQTGRFA